MKILLCLNKDIYCLYFINLILKHLRKYTIIISYSEQIGKKQENINLINLKSIETSGLNFKKLEKDLNATILPEVKNIKDISQNIDLIISIRYGVIFKGDVINFPKYGIVNLHSGILPNYRGIMPTFWSMVNKEKKIGCTLHYIQDTTIDTGDIIDIYKQNIDYNKSYFLNLCSIYKNSSKILLEFLQKFDKKEKIITKAQNSSENYHSYPKEFEVSKFLTKFNFINTDDKNIINLNL